MVVSQFESVPRLPLNFGTEERVATGYSCDPLGRETVGRC
jgi:hypothetical protein